LVFLGGPGHFRRSHAPTLNIAAAEPSFLRKTLKDHAIEVQGMPREKRLRVVD
jgi:hypothetical protein